MLDIAKRELAAVFCSSVAQAFLLCTKCNSPSIKGQFVFRITRSYSHDAMLVQHMLWPCVRLCVYRKSVFFETSEKIQLFFSTYPYLQNDGIFVWNFVQNSERRKKFSPQHVDRRKCCQLSSTVASLSQWASIP